MFAVLHQFFRFSAACVAHPFELTVSSACKAERAGLNVTRSSTARSNNLRREVGFRPLEKRVPLPAPISKIDDPTDSSITRNAYTYDDTLAD